MKPVKCPRCELNYILDGSDYCEICKAELQSKLDAESEAKLDICPECNENPVMPGQELCKACFKEQQKLSSMDKIEADEVEALDDGDDKVEDDEEQDPLADAIIDVLDDADALGLDEDEIPVDIEEDMDDFLMDEDDELEDELLQEDDEEI